MDFERMKPMENTMKSGRRSGVAENWLENAFAEAKTHLTPEQMEDYALNKNDMGVEERKQIEQHLANCSRCRSQID